MEDNMTKTTLALALVAVVGGSAAFYFLVLKRKALDPNQWTKFKLTKKDRVSHNVIKLRFALPATKSILGLPIGQHVSCRGKNLDGVEVIKPYTPTTLDSDGRFFDLVVKVYSEGDMSRFLGRLMEGRDYLEAKGPKGRFKYTPNQVRAFGMVAGGTGITPMFQVARAILENPKDQTNIHLIFANVTADDILLKEEIDTFAKIHPDRFKVYYVLNEPPAEWDGGVGFVSQDMMKAHLPPPASDIMILRCGPPPMNKAMAAHKDALGYTKEMQFQF